MSTPSMVSTKKLSKFGEPTNAAINGISTLSTRAVITAPKAAPMTTATARSTTLPFIIKSRKPFSMVRAYTGQSQQWHKWACDFQSFGKFTGSVYIKISSESLDFPQKHPAHRMICRFAQYQLGPPARRQDVLFQVRLVNTLPNTVSGFPCLNVSELGIAVEVTGRVREGTG